MGKSTINHHGLIAVMLSFKSMDELLRFAVILIDSDSQNPRSEAANPTATLD